MSIALVVAAFAFIFMGGRNDGAPLVALPLQTLQGHLFFPLLLLWAVIPLVPLLGFWQVADSLQSMTGFSTGNQLGSLIVLGSVLATLIISTATSIPTSIALALVGALTGSSLAVGSGVDGPLLTRVILLGLAAPLVAAFLAYLLSRIPLRAAQALPPRRLLAIYRGITFPILAATYALNGGQKMLFAGALAAGVSVGTAAQNPLLLVGIATVFMLGLLSGLRGSARFVRHGVATITPTALLWTEVATAISVTGGSLVGVPLSMTQAITGGLVGTGLSRSKRAVNWTSLQRVGIAWLWTLPLAGTLAYLATILTGGPGPVT